jgi:hypothetical protein
MTRISFSLESRYEHRLRLIPLANARLLSDHSDHNDFGNHECIDQSKCIVQAFYRSALAASRASYF